MLASPLAFTHTVTERFLRYVLIDTQSDPTSPTCPSTEKQKNLGRLGKSADVARAVSFFSSPDADFITGQTLYVCGGASIGSISI